MIYLAADHRGFELKEKIKKWLDEWGEEFRDLGNDHYDPEDDYPDFATAVAKRVEEKKAMGIVICGSGVGVSIVANRFPGIRCGLGFSVEQIRKAREDDDINCLALAVDFTDEEEVEKIIEAFLKTKFSGQEKKKRRIKKIESY